MSRQSLKDEEKAKALEYLHEYLRPGDTVYTILRHVSRSGMSRSISALVILKDGIPYEVSHLVSHAGRGAFDRNSGGVKVNGCGMDMGFHLVYNLSYVLFPDGFDCVGDGCPSNDHSNGQPYDYQYTADTCPGQPCSSACDHVGISPIPHKDGGYALRHRWL